LSSSVQNETSARVHLTVPEARSLAAAALGRLGLEPREADIVAAHLVDAGLCGYEFASLPRILVLAEEIGSRPPPTPIEIVHETPLSAVLDGGGQCGYVTVYRAAEVVIDKAKSHGIAVVGVQNSFLSGRNAYYLEKIASEGLVALHLAGAAPRVVPPGGVSPALGTNPIGFGIPTAEGPFVFDIGTAALMWGEVELFARIGRPLPEGTGVDSSGEPTTDASAALTGGVLPFGGHKGFGLSVAIQALSLLSGARTPHGDVQDYGFLHIALDPALMLPGGDFGAQVSELLERIKATKHKPEVSEIRLPGERAIRERSRRETEGLDYDEIVIRQIEAL
jgi:LDH2 family malate/lactate/ureidoglycolate dehydrogenase